MAKRLNIAVIGNGVSEAAQAEFLIENQCDYLQGDYYCKPLFTNAFSELLKRQQGPDECDDVSNRVIGSV